MALLANTWRDSQFTEGPPEADWTEGVGTVALREGFYRNPSRPDEEILIERDKSVKNQKNDVIRRDVEKFTYELPGAPPSEYNRETWARVYLPGIGRQLHRVELETIVYYPFTPWAQSDNLGRTRYLSAYVVYDLPQDPTAATSSEAAAKATAAGMTPGSTQDRVVSSGRLWSSANMDNAVVPETGAAQTTKWVDNVIIEHDFVSEEWDKWTVWTVEKDATRSGGVQWSGPTHHRKTGIKYKLPVPVEPPEISASNRSGGVHIEIKGGGATIINRYYGPMGRVEIRPEMYHVYRRTVTEPDRSQDDDLYGWWETPPTAEARRTILTNTDVTDFAGAPASALPSAESWDEPHDPDPEPPPTDTAFRRIATVENTKADWEEGWADFLDEDVEDTAEYEYYATAVIGSQESEDSNHETITFSGTGTRTYRITQPTPDTVDAVAPDDPAYPEEEFGEYIDFEIPTFDDPLETGEEITDRQFGANRREDFSIRLTVIHPLLGLEWGQKVKLPDVSWETYANALHLSTETDQDVWLLVGFNRRIERTKDGDWRSPETVLTLQERPRPS
jgi:hypothetical protein